MHHNAGEYGMFSFPFNMQSEMVQVLSVFRYSLILSDGLSDTYKQNGLNTDYNNGFLYTLNSFHQKENGHIRSRIHHIYTYVRKFDGKVLLQPIRHVHCLLVES